MFSNKAIKITILLREGTFKDGSQALEIMGLPVTVNVTKMGGDGLNDAKVRIYNLKYDTVAQLTMLTFKRLSYARNTIKVEAGNDENSLSVVFIGEITSAVPRIDGTDIILDIDSYSGFYPSITPVLPTSVNTNTTIESLMKIFANEAGYSFKNNGVTGSVKNSVFTGSPINKARTLARQCGIDILIDDQQILIQPFSAPKGSYIPVVNKETGMIGYPSFSSTGMEIKCLYNENFRVGRHIKVESVLPQASGEWQIVRVNHRLEAYNPKGGAWETAISCQLTGSETYWYAT